MYTASTVQELIDAVADAEADGGGLVAIEEGTYELPDLGEARCGLLVGSNVVLWGMGKGVILTIADDVENHGTGVVRTKANASRCGFLNLTIDGNAGGNQAHGTWGLVLSETSKCVVRDVRVTNSSSHGLVVMTNSVDNVIDSFEIDLCGGAQLIIYDGCSRNKVVNGRITTPAGKYGVLIDKHSDPSSGTSSNGNTVRSVVFTGGLYGVGVEDSHDTTIDDCTFSGQTGVAIHVVEGQSQIAPRGTTIRGNHITALGGTTGAGINIQAHSTIVLGNQLRDLGACSYAMKQTQASSGNRPLRGNTFQANIVDGVTCTAALGVEDARSLGIYANQFRNITGKGVSLEPLQNINIVQIAQNIFDTISGTFGVGYGIYVVTHSQSGVITDVRISDNTFRDIGVTGPTDAILVIADTVNISRVEVIGNAAIETQSSPTTRHLVSIDTANNGVLDRFFEAGNSEDRITGSIVSPAGYASSGSATLADGAVTVSSKVVKSTDFIALSRRASAAGDLYYDTISAGASFVIRSTGGAADDSQVSWRIIR